MSKKDPEFLDAGALNDAILAAGKRKDLITARQAAKIARDAGLVTDDLKGAAEERFLILEVRKALKQSAGPRPEQLSLWINLEVEDVDEEGRRSIACVYRHVEEATQAEWAAHLDGERRAVRTDMGKVNARTKQYNQYAEVKGWPLREIPFPGV